MATRIIAVDLDNTLLTADRTPHPRSMAAIQRAVAQGVYVVLASGRIGPSVRQIAESMGISHQPRIACNGSDAVGPDHFPIRHWTLSPSVVEAVVGYAANETVQLNLYTISEVLFVSETAWGAVYRQRAGSLEQAAAPLAGLAKMPILKALMVDRPEAVARHRVALAEQLGESARLTESEPEFLEVLPVGVSKASALQALCAHLGIAQEETAAIGDYLNDLEMVQWAGVGGVVANGTSALKAVADRIVSSNENGGVAEFIESLV